MRKVIPLEKVKTKCAAGLQLLAAFDLFGEHRFAQRFELVDQRLELLRIDATDVDLDDFGELKQRAVISWRLRLFPDRQNETGSPQLFAPRHRFGRRGEDAHAAPQPPREKWTFSGPFGTYDRAQLQRGFKIYREVCQACHGLTLVSFRNLSEPGGPGFTKEQVDAIAAEYKVKDGPNDQGEMFERAGRAGDRFPSNFANEQAARAANGGAYPPDMSVLAKARSYERGFPWFLIDIVGQYQEGGPDYIAALLQGYKEPPAGFELPSGSNYNEYFPGHAIGMPQPLQDGQVTYTDGTPATLRQYARDVTAFLMWTAEPHMEARKRLGFQVMIFLLCCRASCTSPRRRSGTRSRSRAKRLPARIRAPPACDNEFARAPGAARHDARHPGPFCVQGSRGVRQRHAVPGLNDQPKPLSGMGTIAADRAGGAHHVGDAHLCQRSAETLLGGRQRRQDRFADQTRNDLRVARTVLDRSGGTQDLFGGNVRRVARQCVAATRTTDARNSPSRTSACNTGSR